MHSQQYLTPAMTSTAQIDNSPQNFYADGRSLAVQADAMGRRFSTGTATTFTTAPSHISNSPAVSPGLDEESNHDSVGVSGGLNLRMSQYHSLPVVSTEKRGIEMSGMDNGLNENGCFIEAAEIAGLYGADLNSFTFGNDHVHFQNNDQFQPQADIPTQPGTAEFAPISGTRPLSAETQMTFTSDVASFVSQSAPHRDSIDVSYAPEFVLTDNNGVVIQDEFCSAVVENQKLTQDQEHGLQFCLPSFDTANPESSFREITFDSGNANCTNDADRAGAIADCNVTDSAIANLDAACEHLKLMGPEDQGQISQNDVSMDMGDGMEPAPTFTLNYPTTPDPSASFCSAVQMQAQSSNNANSDFPLFEQGLEPMPAFARLTPDSILDFNLSLLPEFPTSGYDYASEMLNASSNFSQHQHQPQPQDFSQYPDYNVNAVAYRPSATRESRSYSLPSAPFGNACNDSSVPQGVLEPGANASYGISRQSPLWPSSTQMQLSGSMQSTVTGQTTASTPASVEARSRPATAIGLASGRGADTSFYDEGARQEHKEKHHQKTRSRRESKLESRMKRRASEVVQASSLRIAPKSKVALGEISRPAGEISRPSSRGLASQSKSTKHTSSSASVENGVQSLSEGSSSTQILTRDTPSGPRRYAAISRAARAVHHSTRPKRLCPYAGCANVNGFSGDHELRRHIVREHSKRRPVWVLVDISPDKNVLKNCKKCQAGKRYNAEYNAAEHLRRHLHKHEKQQAKLPLKTLQPWMRMYEEINLGDDKTILVEIPKKKNKALDEHKDDSEKHQKQAGNCLKIEDDEMLPNAGRGEMASRPASRSFVPSPSPSPSPSSSPASFHSAASPGDLSSYGGDE